MLTKDFKYPDTKAHEFVIARLKERGVDLHQLAKIAFDLQQQFIPELTEADCYEELLNVMHKRELLNNAMVALELDRLAEENQIKEPLLSIIRKDAGVFGVDEALALQISDIYGTIGATNFGYLDRVKYGIIKSFDTDENHINTFIDNYNVKDVTKYKLQYLGTNINGVDTTLAKSTAETDYRYISNMNCTSKKTATSDCGVVEWDHENYGNYRLYTLVVTYEGASASKKNENIAARAYIRYCDGNGMLRVFYNDYRQNMYYGGCMCSFDQVKAMASSAVSQSETGS